MQLKDCLKKIPLLFHYIDSHSKEAYGTAIGYLTQEGLLEPVSYALVDSGWIGTIQQSIEHLLRQKQPDRKLEGYYFGLYEIPKGREGKTITVFTSRRGVRSKEKCILATACLRQCFLHRRA